ncbi:putative methyltransferase-domain-containing protein [Phellopilus nigrolimitatus]|nr:putative methyltransferase-domain-containing protein [Phellopilus nigrolimitatus]
MKIKLRKRKAPVTVPSPSTSFGGKLSSTGASASSSANPRASARLIRRFHVLLKRRAQLEKAAESAENARALKAVDGEIASMGGLAAYQRMSSVGQGADRGGGSEKVFIGWLKELRVQEEIVKRKEKGKNKMRLLEVGALVPDNYASCSAWVDTHPIDLRSRHPRIEEQDFLQMDQTTNANAWDAVSLSLVVNFVPEPHDRGRMLRYAHNMLHDGGFLFLALPLPCVSNSRYLTFEHLAGLMHALGFDKTRERWKEGGKMAYWLFTKRMPAQCEKSSGSGNAGPGDADPARFDKKVVLREGKRNNFCILF